MMVETPYMTTEEAASYCRMKPEALRKARERGQVRASRRAGSMTQKSIGKRRARALDEQTGQPYLWLLNLDRQGLSDHAILLRAAIEKAARS